MLFYIAENMENVQTEWRFLGAYQKDYILNLCFFDFLPKVQNIWGKEIRQISFGKPENGKKCYREWETQISRFLGNFLKFWKSSEDSWRVSGDFSKESNYNGIQGKWKMSTIAEWASGMTKEDEENA